MNFTLCELLVYNDNGSVQTLCTKHANARYAKCLHRPIVIIQLKYTIEGVSKILVPRDQIYFPRRSRGK